MYATDRSKAVVPVLSLFCVALWFILRGAHVLCLRVSSFLLALRSPHWEKRDLVCVLLVHLFVSFVRVSFCHFSFPLGVGSWLQFMIVALFY